MIPAADARNAGSGHREAGQATTSSSAQSSPRIDIPDKVTGQVHVHPERPHPGDAARPRASARAAPGANTSQNHFPVSVDESSIKHIPGAQVVQVDNFLAVVAPKEYDAIQAAAQLKVVWKSDPKLAGLRQLLGAGCARPATRTRRTRPATRRDTRQRRRGARVGGEDGVGDLQVPVQQLHADRPARARSPTSSTDQRRRSVCSSQALNERPDDARRLVDGARHRPAGEKIRVDLLRGLELVRRRLRRPRPTEQAAIISKAIGKPVRLQWMRWDQHGWDRYGPAAHVRREDGRRRERQDRRRRLDVATARPATSHDTTSAELARHRRTWPAVPGNGGPTPSDSAVYNDPATHRRVLAKTQPLYGGSFKSNACGRRTRRSRTSPASRSSTSSRTRRRWTRSRSASRTSTASTSAGARWLAVLDACDAGRRLEAEGRRLEPARPATS